MRLGCVSAKSGRFCTRCLPSHLGSCANMQIATSNVVCPAVVSSAIQNNAPVDSSQTVAVSISDDVGLLFDKHVVGHSPDIW